MFQCAGFRGTYLVPVLWSVHYGVPTTIIRFVSFLSFLLPLLSTLSPHGYHSHHEQLPTCWVLGLLPYKDMGRVVLAVGRGNQTVGSLCAYLVTCDRLQTSRKLLLVLSNLDFLLPLGNGVSVMSQGQLRGWMTEAYGEAGWERC